MGDEAELLGTIRRRLRAASDALDQMDRGNAERGRQQLDDIAREVMDAVSQLDPATITAHPLLSRWRERGRIDVMHEWTRYRELPSGRTAPSPTPAASAEPQAPSDGRPLPNTSTETADRVIERRGVAGDIARAVLVEGDRLAARTPLTRWAQDTGYMTAKDISKAGWDPNERDPNGNLPLHVASLVGRDAKVRTLLKSGAEPDAQDAHRLTALRLAAEAGHRKVVTVLVKLGADPNLADGTGAVPLHRACFDLGRDGLATVKTLVKVGADLERPDAAGRSPLLALAHAAAEQRVVSWQSKGVSGDSDVEYRIEEGHLRFFLDGKQKRISAKDERYVAGRWCPAHLRFLDLVDRAVQLLKLGAEPGATGPDGRSAREILAGLDQPSLRKLLPGARFAEGQPQAGP